MPICALHRLKEALTLALLLLFGPFLACQAKNAPAVANFGEDLSRHSWELSRKIAVLDDVLDRYDNRAWPTYGTGEPTNVSINLIIYELGPLNEKEMDYRVDMDLQELWVDERLVLEDLGVNYSFITNEGSLIGNIWKPDIFFVNAKDATTHDITVPNQILQIFPDGVLLFSIRITLQLSCLMDFQLFPLDRQICDIVFRPYSHTDDKVVISWRETDPVVLEFSDDAPEFEVINHQTHSFTRFHLTGNFSSLKLEFLLERDPGFFLIHLYLPLTLAVLMSWHALWLKVEIPQARMVLSVNCLFTIVTVSNGARALIPRVSYLKAADVWTTACILFVYGVILVSAMVNYMSRLKLRALWLRKVDQAVADVCHVCKHGTPSDDFLLQINRANKLEHHRNIKRSESVERNARYLFPICFLFFNIVYWPFYMLRAYAYF